MRRRTVARLKFASANVRCMARHRAFVDRLRPTRRSEQRQAPLWLVLVRVCRPVVQRGRAALNFALAVIARGMLVPRSQSTELWRTTETMRGASATFMLRLIERVLKERAGQRWHQFTLLDRTLMRSEVRSERVFSEIAHHPRIERTAAYPRLTVALARQAPAAPRATVLPATPSATDTRFVFGAQAREVPSNVRDALPPQELARVTDHVLAELDRKVLSFRERHGQI
jgi:hypothetical protein